MVLTGQRENNYSVITVKIIRQNQTINLHLLFIGLKCNNSPTAILHVRTVHDNKLQCNVMIHAQ